MALVVPVTFTVMVQLAVFSAKAPLAKVILSALELDSVPPHCDVVMGPTTVSPTGKVSTNARPAWAGLPTPLLMVKVSAADWLGTITTGLNALVNVVPRTSSVAVNPVAVSPPARPLMLPLAVLLR